MKPWYVCRFRDDRLRKRLAALQQRLDWVNEQLCRVRLAQRLLAEDPDGWRLIRE